MTIKPENLRELVDDLEKHYGEVKARMERADFIYEQQFNNLFNLDYNVPIHQSSTGRSTVDTYRNQFRTDEPTVDFIPNGPSDDAIKMANLMIRWGRAMLLKERTVGELDPNAQVIFDMLLYGAGCKKIVVDVDRIAGKAPRKNNAKYDDWYYKATSLWPFVSRAVSPRSLYPSPGQGKPLLYVVEKQIRRLADMSPYMTEENLPEGFNVFDPRKRHRKGLVGGDLRKLSSEVEWIEYWDNENYIVEADGIRIIDKPNVYGEVPYIWSWSNLGRRGADGNPFYLGVGILTGYEGELEEEVKQKTALSVQTMQQVFTTYLTTEDPQELAKHLALGPGRIIRVEDIERAVKELPKPAPNPNILVYLEKIESNIARLRNVTLSGGRPAGVQYGIHQAQLISQALTAIRPLKVSMDAIGSESLNLMARLSQRLGLTFNLAGNSEMAEKMVNGEDFKHYNFKVEFELIDPAENDRLLLVGEALRRAGDLSFNTFAKKYGKHLYDDPDQELIQIAIERMFLQMVEQGIMLQQVSQTNQPPAQTVTGALERSREATANTPGALLAPMENAEEALPSP